MDKKTIKKIVKFILAIITALATALGVQSFCNPNVYPLIISRL